MKDNTLYELTVDQTHMNIIIRALSNLIYSTYDAIDNDLADVPKATEEIKVASDIQAVLKHQLGLFPTTPKQTSQHTGLVWCKQINLDEQASSYEEDVFDQFNDERLQDNSESLQQAWSKVKERHWDTIKRTGEK